MVISLITMPSLLGIGYLNDKRLVGWCALSVENML